MEDAEHQPAASLLLDLITRHEACNPPPKLSEQDMERLRADAAKAKAIVLAATPGRLRP